MSLPINYKHAHWTVRKQAREEYIRLQNGICLHCKQPLDGEPSKIVLSKRINTKLFPKNFFKWPVHLRHCHKTEMTIGAVHAKCNAVLWPYYGE